MILYHDYVNAMPSNDHTVNILDEMNSSRVVVAEMLNKKPKCFEIYVENVKWRFLCCHNKVLIECITGTQGTYWTVDAQFEIKYTTMDGNTKFSETVFLQSFGDSNSREFMLLASKKINVGQLKIEAKVTVKEIKNLPRITNHRFNREMFPPTSDVLLLVEMIQLRVNKEYLAKNSPVFNAMFNTSFIEMNSKEIRIRDISLVHFYEFLRILYFRKTYTNYRSIICGVLKIADRFDVQWIIKYCEDWLLLDVSKKSTDCLNEGISLLKLADQYKLNQLQRTVIYNFRINKLKTEDIEMNPEFTKLSNEAKLGIYQEFR